MRRTSLSAVPPADHSAEPGYREWKTSAWGKCAICGEDGRLERHHVIAEQEVRRRASAEQIAAGIVWDLRNSLELGAHCRCHSRHTNAAQRLPASKVSAHAIEFAIELLGAGPADLYFDRFYAPA